MKEMNIKQLKCANCGCKIPDATWRNVDGEPCCKACWDAEEEQLAHEH